MYCEVASKGTKISLLLTDSVWERIEEDFQNQKSILEKMDNVQILIYQNEFVPPTIIVTDVFLLLSILNKEDKYDHRDILSFDVNALKWGRELFIHYLESSFKVI
jgi:predicted transcriptional regulator